MEMKSTLMVATLNGLKGWLNKFPEKWGPRFSADSQE